MAEVVGLAASIIQIAGAGAKLSVALYNFTSSAARADQDIKGIADDVELTANALESVGKVFESEDARSIVSKKAIQDANNIIKKCQSVFDEVSEMVEKRRKMGKDRKKSLSMMGKLAWPMKEQRVELNRRRLESLKNSLVLLLHVLQLAQGQSRGRMEKSVMEEERDKIRELHQRQQDSLKSLQALENRFCNVALDDEETLRGSSISSRVPTLTLMADTQAMEMPPLEKDARSKANTITIDLSGADDSNTSDSDATMTDEDDEHISIEELSRAAKHVTKLLKRITVLQKSLDNNEKPHRKRRVHKIYQRFCRKFESGINVAPGASSPTYASPEKQAPNQDTQGFDLDLDFAEDAGALENFDFDSFLHVPSESTAFSVADFDFEFEPASQQLDDATLVSLEQSQPHLSDTRGMVIQAPVPPGAAHINPKSLTLEEKPRPQLKRGRPKPGKKYSGSQQTSVRQPSNDKEAEKTPAIEHVQPRPKPAPSIVPDHHKPNMEFNSAPAPPGMPPQLSPQNIAQMMRPSRSHSYGTTTSQDQPSRSAHLYGQQLLQKIESPKSPMTGQGAASQQNPSLSGEPQQRVIPLASHQQAQVQQQQLLLPPPEQFQALSQQARVQAQTQRQAAIQAQRQSTAGHSPSDTRNGISDTEISPGDIPLPESIADSNLPSYIDRRNVLKRSRSRSDVGESLGLAELMTQHSRGNAPSVKRKKKSIHSSRPTIGLSGPSSAAEGFQPDDGTKQDDGHSHNKKKKPRMGSDTDGSYPKDAFDFSLEQKEKEESIDLASSLDSRIKDIVDVLLEQWTVPVC
ncbi:hypothetical protein G6011_02546 [Alternaria panax]|uniref:Fungal N-terminal domain-containing protein n=1 Tax=Alternaria panax TaxID=48097 RepID=A0AAD4FAQ9_9PLEO|nr:hypothetical protein G6011_02546 [Alternaria panax]